MVTKMAIFDKFLKSPGLRGRECHLFIKFEFFSANPQIKYLRYQGFRVLFRLFCTIYQSAMLVDILNEIATLWVITRVSHFGKKFEQTFLIYLFEWEPGLTELNSNFLPKWDTLLITHRVAISFKICTNITDW